MLTTLDFAILAAYVLGLVALGAWISLRAKKTQSSTVDYFLADKALPWWAIGASLIASNISAEQIIGMSGSGYAIGLAIASYEWMAAITLLIVAKYMLPIFIKNNILTMPQYLEQRYDSRVRTVMALFWLAVYVFVNLTAILWLGGLAIETVTGVSATAGMIFLAVFSLAYSLYGGLKVVAYTDIIQVTLLVFGGLFLSYLALNSLADDQGIIAGFKVLSNELPGHFDMILNSDHPHYMSLPGISVLVGGLWVMNFSYWGFNQYIIQRALAAKNIKEAQKGIVFAAFLKVLMPLIVVLPGIIAVIKFPDLSSPDQAYPSMMGIMPAGIKGLVFAALVAAIVSSIASMTNSIATIFTMDVYQHFTKQKSQSYYVRIGRAVSFLSLCVALVIAKPLLGKFDQAFQYIQEFTGFFTPGIVVIFLLGMFWKRTNADGALFAAIGSALFSVLLKVFWPELPFMDRVGLVFLICLALCAGISLLRSNHSKATVDIKEINFSTTTAFNLASAIVILILIFLYTIWW
ncbi:MAG: sodium/sugar symporter [Glaciecola sp.]|nr:sodium/sugar symporter [Glaciecola sp.]MDG2099901.1 sodium/sugar symporter [Glaciecola sp.]